MELQKSTDISIPHTDETLKFIKLSADDKVKVVTLGMKFLNLGNQQMQMWDNSQWETRMATIKAQKQADIDSLQDKLYQSNMKIQTIQQNHKNELESIIDGVRSRTESKFISEIASLKDDLEK